MTLRNRVRRLIGTLQRERDNTPLYVPNPKRPTPDLCNTLAAGDQTIDVLRMLAAEIADARKLPDTEIRKSLTDWSGLLRIAASTLECTHQSFEAHLLPEEMRP